MDRIEINGSPASVGDLRLLASVNYGHFTVLRTQGRSARGLDLHLARLARSTELLFGSALDLAATRRWMAQVLDDAPTMASLRVNVFSRQLDRDRLTRAAAPDVLVQRSPARHADATPVRVKSLRYARERPDIKHVGTFGLFDQRRRAQALGYDDALFVDAAGAIAEGSIWNIGFLDDDGVVWPDAPALQGVSMQLLQAGLAAAGAASRQATVRLADLGGLRGAFFTNAGLAVLPIASIDDIVFDNDADRLQQLEDAYASRPWQAI